MAKLRSPSDERMLVCTGKLLRALARRCCGGNGCRAALKLAGLVSTFARSGPRRLSRRSRAACGSLCLHGLARRGGTFGGGASGSGALGLARESLRRDGVRRLALEGLFHGARDAR